MQIDPHTNGSYTIVTLLLGGLSFVTAAFGAVSKVLWGRLQTLMDLVIGAYKEMAEKTASIALLDERLKRIEHQLEHLLNALGVERK